MTDFDAVAMHLADEIDRAGLNGNIVRDIVNQRNELLDALQCLEDVASFIPVEDRRERRHLGESIEKARAAIAKQYASNVLT